MTFNETLIDKATDLVRAYEEYNDAAESLQDGRNRLSRGEISHKEYTPLVKNVGKKMNETSKLETDLLKFIKAEAKNV